MKLFRNTDFLTDKFFFQEIVKKDLIKINLSFPKFVKQEIRKIKNVSLAQSTLNSCIKYGIVNF